MHFFDSISAGLRDLIHGEPAKDKAMDNKELQDIEKEALAIKEKERELAKETLKILHEEAKDLGVDGKQLEQNEEGQDSSLALLTATQKVLTEIEILDQIAVKTDESNESQVNENSVQIKEEKNTEIVTPNPTNEDEIDWANYDWGENLFKGESSTEQKIVPEEVKTKETKVKASKVEEESLLDRIGKKARETYDQAKKKAEAFINDKPKDASVHDATDADKDQGEGWLDRFREAVDEANKKVTTLFNDEEKPSEKKGENVEPSIEEIVKEDEAKGPEIEASPQKEEGWLDRVRNQARKAYENYINDEETLADKVDRLKQNADKLWDEALQNADKKIELIKKKGVLNSVAASLCALTPEELEQEHEAIKQEYFNRFKDDADPFLQTLLQLQPKIANGIIELISEEDLPLNLQETVRDQLQPGGTVYHLIEVLLPRVILNIAEQTQAETLADALALFMAELLETFDSVDEMLGKVDNKLSKQQRKENIKNIFGLFIDKTLLFVFPKGVKELLLAPIVADILWLAIRKGAGQELYSIYKQSSRIDLLSKEKALNAEENSKGYLQITAALGKVIEKKLPELLTEGSDGIAKEIYAELAPINDLQPENKELQHWLSGVIQNIVNNEDPRFTRLWSLLGDKIELVGQHLLYHVLQSNRIGDVPTDSSSLADALAPIGVYLRHGLRALEKANDQEPSDEQLTLLFQHFIKQAFITVGLPAEEKKTLSIQEKIQKKLAGHKEINKPKTLPYYNKIEALLTKQLIAAYRQSVEKEKLVVTYRAKCSPELAQACRHTAQNAVETATKLLNLHQGSLEDLLFDVLAEEFQCSTVDKVQELALEDNLAVLKSNLHSELAWLSGKNPTAQELQTMLAEHLEILLLKTFADRIDLRADPEKFQELKQQNLKAVIKALDSASEQLGKPQKASKIAQKELNKLKLHLKDQLEKVQKQKGKAHPNEAKLKSARSEVAKLKARITEKKQELHNLHIQEARQQMVEADGNILENLGLKGPEDLGLPMSIAKPLWDSLMANIVPKLMVAGQELVLDPLLMKKMAIIAIDLYKETVDAIESGKISVPEAIADEDELQNDLNKAFGRLLISALKAYPLPAELPLENEGLSAIVAPKIGMALRKMTGQLEDGAVENFLAAGLLPLDKISSLLLEQSPETHTPEEVEETDIARMQDEQKIDESIESQAIALALETAKKIFGIEGEFEEAAALVEKECQELLGHDSDAILELLKIADVKIEGSIINALADQPLSPHLNELISEQLKPHSALSSLLKIAVLRLLIDYAKKQQASLSSEQQAEQLAVPHGRLTDAVAYLLGDLGGHLEAVMAKTAALDPKLPKEKRLEVIKAGFSPLSDELMGLLIPAKDPQDLELISSLRDILQAVTKEIVLNSSAALYNKVAALNIGAPKGKNTPFYARLSKAVAKVAEKKIPELVAESHEKIASEIVKQLDTASPELSQWLGSLIQQISSKDSSFKTVWQQVGDKVELVTEHLMFHLLLAAKNVPQKGGSAVGELVAGIALELNEKLSQAQSDEERQQVCHEFIVKALDTVGLPSEEAAKLPFFKEIEEAIADKLIAIQQQSLESEQLAEEHRKKLSPQQAAACKETAEKAVESAFKVIKKNQGSFEKLLYDIIGSEFANAEIPEVKALGNYWKSNGGTMKAGIGKEIAWPEGSQRAAQQLKALISQQIEKKLLQAFADRVELRKDLIKFEEEKQKNLQTIIKGLHDAAEQLRKAPDEQQLLQQEIGKLQLEIKEQLKVVKKLRGKLSKKLEMTRAKVKQLKAQLAKKKAALHRLRLAETTQQMVKENGGKAFETMALTGPEDLGLPMSLAQPLWDSMLTNIAPKLIVKAQELLLDPLLMKKMALLAIDLYKETVHAIESGKLMVPDALPVEDQLQVDIGAACGNLILAGLEKYPLPAELPLTNASIRSILAPKLGAALPQMTDKLENGAVENFVTAGLLPFDSIVKAASLQSESETDELTDLALLDEEQQIDKDIETQAVALALDTAKKILAIQGDFKEAISAIEKECQEFLGHDINTVLDLLQIAGVKIEESISKALAKQDLTPHLKGLIAEQLKPEGALDSSLKIVLLRLLINHAKKQQASLTEEEKRARQQIPGGRLADAIAELLGDFNIDLEPSLAKAAEVNALVSKQERMKALKIAFAPLADKIMVLVLPPAGNKDLTLISTVREILRDVAKELVLDSSASLYKKVAALNIGAQNEEEPKIKHSAFCGLLSKAIGKIVEKKLPEAIVDSNDKIAAEITKQLGAKQPQLAKKLEAIIKEVAGNKNPKFKEIWQTIGNKVEAVAGHLLLNLLLATKNMPLNGESAVGEFFADLTLQMHSQLRQVAKKAHGRPDDIDLKAVCDAAILDALEKVGLPREKVTKLPFFKEVQSAISKELIAVYRQDLASKMLANEHKAKLSPLLITACKNISKQTVDIAFQLVEQHKVTLEEAFFDIIGNEFASSSIPEVKALASYWHANADEMKEAISKELVWANGAQPTAEQLKALLSKQIERTLFKAFAERADLRKDPVRLEKAKTEKVEMIISALDEANKRLKEITANIGKDVEKSDLQKTHEKLAKLKTQLRSELKVIRNLRKQKNQAAQLSAARQNAQNLKAKIAKHEKVLHALRLAKCNPEMAEQVLAAMGLNDVADLGLPKSLAEPMWQSLTENVVPKLFVAAQEIALDPVQLKKIELEALSICHAAMKAYDEGTLVLPEATALTPDEMLKNKLNQACGNVILSSLEATSMNFAAWVFKNDSIRNFVAQKVGETVLKSVDQLDGQSIEAFLEASLKNPDLLPKASLISDGKTAAINKIAQKALSPQEIEDSDIAKMEEEERLESNIKSKAVKIAFTAGKMALGITRIQRAWKKFQENFDKGVLSVFGKIGLKIKQFFDAIFRFIFFTFLGTILLFPIRLLLLYIKKKMKEAIQPVISDTHLPESLFYLLCEKTFAMNKEKRKEREEEEIIENPPQLKRRPVAPG